MSADADALPVFCARCGERNPRTNRFCGTCGTQLVLPPEPNMPSPAESESVHPTAHTTTVEPHPTPAAPIRTERVTPPTPPLPPPDLSTPPEARQREVDRLLTAANVQRMRAQIVGARKTLDQALVIAESIAPAATAPVLEQQGHMLAAEERWEEAKTKYELALSRFDNDRPAIEKRLAEVSLHLSDEAALKRLGGQLRGDDLADILAEGRTGQRHAGLTMVMSLIPGFGQFYCGQLVKGGILLAVFLVALVIISLAPEKADYLQLVGATLTMKAFRAHVPAYLHVCGFVAIAAWLYSVVDAPFTAKATSDGGADYVVPPAGNRADWEP